MNATNSSLDKGKEPAKVASPGKEAASQKAVSGSGASAAGSPTPKAQANKQPPFDPAASLTANIRNTAKGMSMATSMLRILNLFHAHQGVSGSPHDIEDLFPRDWRVGRTPINVTDSGGAIWTTIDRILPTLHGYDKDGREVRWIDEGANSADIVRLTAVWESPVTIVAAILSTVKGAQVSRDDVLKVAERSPQALEALKQAGKELKEHITRMLDPVALRRSPEFNRVAQRYKRELRAAIEEQQRLIRDAKAATRRVNQILGERDEALSSLDPGYTAKRATAASALRQFGIDLGSAMSPDDPEGNVASGVLDDLDF